MLLFKIEIENYFFKIEPNSFKNLVGLLYDFKQAIIVL